jgi:hypothetical protein
LGPKQQEKILKWASCHTSDAHKDGWEKMNQKSTQDYDDHCEISVLFSATWDSFNALERDVDI